MDGEKLGEVKRSDPSSGRVGDQCEMRELSDENTTTGKDDDSKSAPHGKEVRET